MVLKKSNELTYIDKSNTDTFRRGLATAKNTRRCRAWWQSGKGYKRI